VIGLDTNVLVRYLTQDDPAQAVKAARVIESAEAAGLFVSAVVVCELVWVLEESYDQKREQIAQVLERLLLSGQLVFENKDLLWLVLADYRQGKGDVADYVIGRLADRAGASETVTFDRGLKGSELFRLL
jgi:predicted nucleic-acid-binding protein